MVRNSLSVLSQVTITGTDPDLRARRLFALSAASRQLSDATLKARGERALAQPRSQLLFKQAGTGNIVILAVNVFAVDCYLPFPALWNVKKCIERSIQCLTPALRALAIRTSKYEHQLLWLVAWKLARSLFA